MADDKKKIGPEVETPAEASATEQPGYVQFAAELFFQKGNRRTALRLVPGLPGANGSGAI